MIAPAPTKPTPEQSAFALRYVAGRVAFFGSLVIAGIMLIAVGLLKQGLGVIGGSAASLLAVALIPLALGLLLVAAHALTKSWRHRPGGAQLHPTASAYGRYIVAAGAEARQQVRPVLISPEDRGLRVCDAANLEMVVAAVTATELEHAAMFRHWPLRGEFVEVSRLDGTFYLYIGKWGMKRIRSVMS